MAPVPRPPKPGRPPFRKGGSNTPPPFMSPGGPPGLSVPPKTGSPKPVPVPKSPAVRAYGERNPPNTGPKDPEPSPGTGKYPLPKPRPPRPRGIPGGGQGGEAPPGFGGPRRIPSPKKSSYGEASILRFITTKPRPK